MSVTVSAHLPLLLRVSGWSRNEPTQTSPKLPFPAIATASRGAGAIPVTDSVCGLAGSSLNTVIVAVFAPRLDGWKRRSTSSDSPGLTMSGYEATPGARNSAEDEMILNIDSGQDPELLIESWASRKEPRHTSPKLPAFAIAVASVPKPRIPLADRSTTG